MNDDELRQVYTDRPRNWQRSVRRAPPPPKPDIGGAGAAFLWILIGCAVGLAIVTLGWSIYVAATR